MTHRKEHDDLLASAESDPRLAYNYAQTEDGDADREQGRKVQERTVRVMRFSLFLGLLVVAGVFLGFLLGGLLKDKPTLIIACIMFPLAFLLVLAVVGEGERQVIIILGSQDVGVAAKRRRQQFKTRELETVPQTMRGLSARR